MPAEKFSADDLRALDDLLTEMLSNGPLPWPFKGESEVPYSARVLRPLISERLESLTIRGLALSGAGGTPTNPVGFAGRFFYPDFTVTYLRQKLHAIEVKFIRNEFNQGAIATAVGQAAIYHAGGFPSALALLVDLTRPSTFGDQGGSPPAVDSIFPGVKLLLKRPL